MKYTFIVINIMMLSQICSALEDPFINIRKIDGAKANSITMLVDKDNPSEYADGMEYSITKKNIKYDIRICAMNERLKNGSVVEWWLGLVGKPNNNGEIFTDISTSDSKAVIGLCKNTDNKLAPHLHSIVNGKYYIVINGGNNSDEIKGIYQEVIKNEIHVYSIRYVIEYLGVK